MTPTVERIALLDVPHRELAGLLRSGAPVYLTVNPVEYHGPHLSLHNDHVVSVGLSERLHLRLRDVVGDAPLLMAASIEAGVEPCQGPGTRATDYPTLRRMVREACRALMDLGAKRVVLMTFHGAPLHAWALQAGVDVVRARGGQAFVPLNVVLQDAIHTDPDEVNAAFAHIADPAERKRVHDGLGHDFHAGFFETSIALALAPETVSAVHKRLPPCPPLPKNPVMREAARLARRAGQTTLAQELDFAALGLGWSSLRPFPGYTGSPHLATPEAGEVFVDAMLGRFERAARTVFAGGAPPLPIMPWLLPLTAYGRIPGVVVPLDAVATLRDLGLSNEEQSASVG